MNKDPEILEIWFAAVKAVSCKAVATSENWVLVGDVIQSGDCPKCRHSNTFSIHTKANRWKCVQCEKRGSDAVSLMVHMHGIPYQTAALWLVPEGPPAPPEETDLARRWPVRDLYAPPGSDRAGRT